MSATAATAAGAVTISRTFLLKKLFISLLIDLLHGLRRALQMILNARQNKKMTTIFAMSTTSKIVENNSYMHQDAFCVFQ